MPLTLHTAGPEDAEVGVLVHASGLSGADMLRLCRVPGYRLLAPDRTNYGRGRRPEAVANSAARFGPPDVVPLAADAAEVTGLLGAGAHLLGYSYGGVVALLAAVRRPDVVRSLTLLEPPAFQVAIDDPDAVETRDRILRATGEVWKEGPRSYWRRFMTGTFGHRHPVPPDLLPEGRAAAAMREEIPWLVDLDLDAIAVAGIPVLVVCGGWDAGFTAVSRRLAERLGGRLLEFPRADHFFLEEWRVITQEVAALWHRAEDTAAFS